MKEQLYPEPTIAQKIALVIGKKDGFPYTVFRRIGEENADVSLKYNTGVYVGTIAGGMVSLSIGMVTWRDLPRLITGRYKYWVWKRSRDKVHIE